MNSSIVIYNLFQYQVDYEPSIALKEPIDLNELRKEDGEGTMFEIKEEDVYGECVLN